MVMRGLILCILWEDISDPWLACETNEVIDIPSMENKIDVALYYYCPILYSQIILFLHLIKEGPERLTCWLCFLSSVDKTNKEGVMKVNLAV